jgi:hypothetical protein
VAVNIAFKTRGVVALTHKLALADVQVLAALETFWLAFLGVADVLVGKVLGDMGVTDGMIENVARIRENLS